MLAQYEYQVGAFQENLHIHRYNFAGEWVYNNVRARREANIESNCEVNLTLDREDHVKLNHHSHFITLINLMTVSQSSRQFVTGRWQGYIQ